MYIRGIHYIKNYQDMLFSLGHPLHPKPLWFLSGTTSVFLHSMDDTLKNPGVGPLSRKVEIWKLICSFLDVSFGHIVCQKPCTAMYNIVQLCTTVYISAHISTRFYNLVQLCTNLYNLVQPCAILYNNVQVCTALYNNVQSCKLCTTVYNCVQPCTTVYNLVQLCIPLCNRVQLYTTLYNLNEAKFQFSDLYLSGKWSNS